MKIRYNKRGAAVLLAMLLVIQGCLGYIRPSMDSYAYTARSATVNASSLNVRSGPGTSYSIVGKLSQGTAVTVLNETKASDGVTWYQIRFSGSSGAETTGYALHSYIKFPVNYTTSADFEANLAAQGFPESYKQGLRQLHAQYPQWVFTAQHTNLDWNTVISNEAVVGRNLVSNSSISSWKSIGPGAYNWDTSSWPGFDGSSWVAASEDILRYYMDPRNFLDDTYVFQFLLQSYDSSVHTAEGLEMMVKGSFLESKATSGGVPDSGSSGGPGSAVTGQENSSGNTGGPGGNNQNQTAEDSNSGISFEAPGGGSGGSGGNDGGPSGGSGGQVSLEGPSASISQRDRNRVATAIGPGMTGGPGSGGPESNNSGTSGGPGVSGPGASGGGGGTGSAPMSGSSSYIDIILNAGAQSGVNPYVLAAMIIQEQGSTGTSPLISGTYSGYEGHYNFFNIEAYQTGTMSAIQRGLWYAAQSGSYGRPWNSVEKSILGGAQIYGDSYVKAGQNTFYLKKFNVQGNNLYKHQYMTNVQGAASEGAIYAKAYTPELRSTALEFRIPVYKNMPELPCGKPTQTGSPNNKLAGLGVDGFAVTPTFNKDTASYDLIVNTSVNQVNVHAAAIDSTAIVSGTGTINLQSGSNDITISVKAQNGTVREYKIHVVKRDNGPTSDGSIHSGTGGGGSLGPGVSGGPGASQGNTGGSSQGSSGNQGPGGPGAGSSGPGSSGPGGSGSGNTGSGTGPGGSDIVIIP